MFPDGVPKTLGARGFSGPDPSAGELADKAIDQGRASSVGWEKMEMEPRVLGEPSSNGGRGRGEAAVQQQVHVQWRRRLPVHDL